VNAKEQEVFVFDDFETKKIGKFSRFSLLRGIIEGCRSRWDDHFDVSMSVYWCVWKRWQKSTNKKMKKSLKMICKVSFTHNTQHSNNSSLNPLQYCWFEFSVKVNIYEDYSLKPKRREKWKTREKK
jgi:hypothetical protein